MPEKNNITTYNVSIIVPIYNCEKYLHKCIDSLLAQTLPNIEIILIDDGSTDNSGNICENYANNHKNIKVFHQQNSGPAKARNIGLENANGEYIGFVDSDDYISPDMYETLYNLAIKNNIDVVTGDYYTVTDNQKSHSGKFNIPSNRVINSDEISKILMNANESRILWFAVKGIYRLEIIKNNSIVFPKMKLGEETIFILEFLLSASSMYYIDKPFYFYEQTPDSLTRTKYKENLLPQLEKLYFAKKEIYHKHNFNSYSADLDSYTMKHTIPMLLSNEMAHKCKLSEKIKIYKKMRHSKMIKSAFANSSVKLINSKLKYMALLLKFRMYIILALLSR